MKTLLFTLEFPPFKGGIAEYYGQLAKHWSPNEILEILHNNQNEIIKPGRVFFAWRQGFRVFRKKIISSRPDYVLVGQILPLGTIAYILSYLYPFKYGVFLHGMDFTYALKSRRKRFLAGLILKRADKIIAANQYLAGLIKEFQPSLSQKIEVINPGVSEAPVVSESQLQELRQRYKLDNKFILLSLGRLVRRKGFDQVIKVLQEMPAADIKDLRYFIAGEGEIKEELINLVSPELKDKIFFLGSISEEEKWAWLRLCQLFIMPVREIDGDFEGFGIVYLEAGLAAKPVLAGRSGGVSDAVLDGQTGLLVDTKDPNNEELKRALKILINDSELREKLGREGRERALQDFSWDKQVSKLINFIKTGNEK